MFEAIQVKVLNRTQTGPRLCLYKARGYSSDTEKSTRGLKMFDGTSVANLSSSKERGESRWWDKNYHPTRNQDLLLDT